MKVLLIYPPVQASPNIRRFFRPPPLAFLQLSAMIPDHKTEILDLNTNSRINLNELKKKISKFDIIGVNCNSNMVKIALNICRIAKRSGIQTVIGGYHPTLNPDMIKNPVIDFIVRGEGEYTFKELIDGVEPKRILGLSYKDNHGGNGVHHNKQRPLISNLNDLPLPRRDLINYSGYNYLLIPLDMMETSRGCPFNCNFCCVAKFYNRTWRKKSAMRVIKELYTVPKSQKLVFFVDDNFTNNPNRVKELCKKIREYGLHHRFMFVCQARVDDLAKNPEMIQIMAQTGFISFFIGIESIHQKSLDIIGKRITVNQIKKAVKYCHDNGIIVIGSIIIGNIGETKEDVLKNFKLMKKLKINFILTNPLIPYYGTQLWEQAVKNGWIEKDFDWENWKNSAPIMNTPDLSIEEIQRLQDSAYKRFYFDIHYMHSNVTSMKLHKNKLFFRIMIGSMFNILKNFRI
ncbi:MAG: B12-binding domain-containing radical SAM protein [Candidatus Helarchaeota archaeon]